MAAGFSTYLRVVILVDHINQIRTVDLESWIVMIMRRRCFNADQKIGLGNLIEEEEKKKKAIEKMGKQPVKMRAVVYALSPFQQKVMPGLWKDLPAKIHHKVSENWLSATLLIAPLVAVHA